MTDRFDEGGEGFEREIAPLVRELVILQVEPCFGGLLGIGVWGLEFVFCGVWCVVWGLGLGVSGLGFGVEGSGFGVQGFRV